MAERLATLEQKTISPDRAFLIDTVSVPLDDINISAGGRLGLISDLINAEVIAKPSERILPPQEPLAPKERTLIDSEKFMQTVTQRRYEFYKDLGLLHELNVVRNYDIPLARVMWEQMKTEEQKRMWKEYETGQILAALGERYNVVEATPRYIIDDEGKFRYAAFPIEPFEVADKRAIEHYKNIKSPDAIREQAGHRGRLKIQEKMSDPSTAFETTIVHVSGPGLAEGSKQLHNFVWLYVLKQHPVTGQRLVEVTPLMSNASYPQYEANISKIRPEYFKEKTGPEDLYLLENPIEFTNKSVPEIFKELTGELKAHKPNEKFQKFKEENISRVRYLLEAICAAVFDPSEAAKRADILLVGGDIIWKGLQKVGDKASEAGLKVLNFMRSFKTRAEEIAYLMKQNIDTVLAACGFSGRLLRGGIRLALSALIGLASAAPALDKDKLETRYYLCKTCWTASRRPKDDVDDVCGNCGDGEVGCAPSEELPKAA